MNLDAATVSHLNNLFMGGIELFTAHQEISSIASDFSNAVRFGQQLAAGEAPADPGSHWSALTRNYLQASQRIASNPLETEFNEKPFQWDWREYRGCHTRDGTLEKMAGYSSAMASALLAGEEASSRQALLLQELTQIGLAVSELKRLLEIAPQLFNVQMDWLALQNSVGPAVSELSITINSRQKNLKNAISKLNIAKNNFDYNLKLLRDSPCSLAGAWAGEIVLEGETISMRLEIQGDPGAYSIGYALAGRANNKPLIETIDSTARRIEFRPSPTSSLRFMLDIAASYTAMTGIEVDESDPYVRYPILLRRL